MYKDKTKLKFFAQDLLNLKRAALEALSKNDYVHLKKIIWTNRTFLLIGYMTAWIIPNPISMLCIAISLTGMWTIVAHYVCHAGYNKVPSIPKRYTTNVFARGWRRFIDWPDWIYPPAWKYEHNVMHHFYVNEKNDPDQLFYRLKVSDLKNLPSKQKWLALIIIILHTGIWKASYYAPNTLKAQYEKENFLQDADFTKYYLKAFLFCYLPYMITQYILFPLPFTLISFKAYIFVILNRVGAEVFSNWHTFMLIAPNHTGEDLFLQNHHFENKEEFYLAQILSSCNYKTGGYWNDYFHGYLNYQIEHHLFPDLPPSQYVILQPKVKALCQKYGIRYLQEPLFKRLKKLFDIMIQKSYMQPTKIINIKENENVI